MNLRRKNLLVDSAGKPLSSSGYVAADYNRYNQDFTILAYSPNQLISLASNAIRARAQDLERNSDHIRRFLALVENNVIGPTGIRLQSKATRSEMTETPDRPAIRLVESQWLDWTMDCSVTGEESLIDISKMLIRRRIVDGEVFIEWLPGHKNEHNFALRVWASEACPIGLNDADKKIANGIQYDNWGKPVAYFFHKSGYGSGYTSGHEELMTVPASRVAHLFRRERPGQRRGISELSSSAERLHMLSKFEKATLIGAQIASSKMGFFRDKDEATPSYTGDGEAYEGGHNEIIIQAGQFEDIGRKEFQAFDPEYPPAKYEEFVHEILRSAASGLNISYHVFANDPRSVNYSTAREFRLQDTDAWRDQQQTFTRKVLRPIFRAWLKTQMLRGPLSRYKTDDYKRLSFVNWQPRGWAWVDPQKEANGNMLAVQIGSKSLTDIAAEQGRDYEEVIEQIQRDKEFAEAHGVDLSNIWAAIAPEEEDEEDTVKVVEEDEE